MDVERVWSAATKSKVRAGMLKVTGERSAEYRERVVTQMDSFTRDWVMMQESICKDTLERQIMPVEVYNKVSLCLRTTLVSQRTIADSLQSPTAGVLFSASGALDEIRQDAVDCQSEAIYSFYAVQDGDVAAQARVLLARAEALSSIQSPDAIEAAAKAQEASRRTSDKSIRLRALLDEAWQAFKDARYSVSLRLATEASKQAENIGDQPLLARALNNIGAVYFKQSNYEKALISYDRALRLREKSLGATHPKTASTLNNIGLVHSHLGQTAQALEYFRKALAIEEASLGAEHPELALTFGNIGNLYESQGKFDDALSMHRRALAIQLASIGEEHPDTALVYGNIGNALMQQNRFEEAVEAQEKALSIRLRLLGTEHPDTATSYLNLGNVYATQKDFPAARAMFQEALDILLKVFGENHTLTAIAYLNLGATYDELSDPQRALELLLRALRIFENVLGKEHARTRLAASEIDLLCTEKKYMPACSAG